MGIDNLGIRRTVSGEILNYSEIDPLRNLGDYQIFAFYEIRKSKNDLKLFTQNVNSYSFIK